MRAMVLERAGEPLVARDVDPPAPGPGQVRLRVLACGVCRTDLHVIDGELADPKLPLVLGHQIVGEVDELGSGVAGLEVGERVGVPWLGWTCGVCGFCTSGRENLCAKARFTGYQLDGGYAEAAVADERFCFPIPPGGDSEHTAPLLCAGLIGWRSLKMTGDAERLGIYGFGAAAHIVYAGREVSRSARVRVHQARRRGRTVVRPRAWAPSGRAVRISAPPEELDAAILFAPAGALVPAALRQRRARWGRSSAARST